MLKSCFLTDFIKILMLKSCYYFIKKINTKIMVVNTTSNIK